MGKLKLKLLLIISITVVIASIILPCLGLGTQTANAAYVDIGGGGGDASVQDRAITWSVLNELGPSSHGRADNMCSLPTSISATDATAGTFWGTYHWYDVVNPFSGKDNGIVGIHVPGTGSDGTWVCNDDSGSLMNSMLQMWGYPSDDTVQFLTNLGYTLNNSSGKYTISTPPSLLDIATVIPNPTPPPSDTNPVTDAFFTNGSVSSPSQDVEYYIYSNDFMNGCGASSPSPYSSASPDELALLKANPPKAFEIEYVDPSTGDISDDIVTTTKTGKDSVVIGFGIPPNNSGGDATCSQLAGYLKNKSLATAYSNTIQSGGGGGGVTPTTTSDACLSWNPVSWILCPIIEGAGKAIGLGDTMVQSLLKIQPSDYGVGLPKSQYPANPVQTAWSAIRIISTILLVGIALFMIISQIIGYDFFDAYTIKKILPRLVVAVILIQLSWILIVGAIDFINILGTGVQDLLLAPFGINPNNVTGIVQIIQQNKTFGTTAATGTVFLGVSVALILSSGSGLLFGLVALAIAAIIAVMVVVVILIIRRLLVTALLIAAPLALLAMILPGTQKYWKMWWSNISKLLLMFPLIMGLMAIGKDFAWIAASTSSTDTSTITFFIILIAYFGPFFFIPMTFKWGGGLMTASAGAISKTGGKLKTSITNSKPYQNLQKSGEYNRHQKGVIRAGSSNRFVRTYGRLQAGTAGAHGAFAEQLRGAEEKQSMDNAKLEYSSAVAGMNGAGIQEANRRIRDTAIGSRITLDNGKRATVTQEMQRTAMSSALTMRQPDILDGYVNAGTPAEQPARRENLNKFIQENFPAVDAQMPDLSRATTITPANEHGVLQASANNYSNLDDNRRQQTLLAIAGSEPELSAGYLNDIANNRETTRQHLDEVGRSFGIDLNQVKSSGGTIRVQYNPGARGRGRYTLEGINAVPGQPQPQAPPQQAAPPHDDQHNTRTPGGPAGAGNIIMG